MGAEPIPSDAPSRTPVKSAARVLDVLEALAATPDGLGFSALATALELPKSSLHELLGVLTDRGYVAFDAPRRVYALGIRIWETGQAYGRHRDLAREAVPMMERVVEAINETVQLAILDGVENVYLAKVDCSHPVRLQSQVGKRLPAHATGLGKALLAHLDPAELDRRLAGRVLARYTDRTIADDRLRVDLAVSRARGFAFDDQEYTPGLRCVAVPIHAEGEETVAAISASIPTMRAGPAEMAAALRTLARASIRLSRRLGAASDDPRLLALADGAGADDAIARIPGLSDEPAHLAEATIATATAAATATAPVAADRDEDADTRWGPRLVAAGEGGTDEDG